MTDYSSEAAREAARDKTNGQFGEQKRTDPGVAILDDAVVSITPRPITNLADCCLTGADRERFTYAAAEALQADPDNFSDEQWSLIHAKRLADKVARLFPGATKVTLEREGDSSTGRIRVTAVEPYGQIDYRNSTDSLGDLLNEDADQLRFRRHHWLSWRDIDRCSATATFDVAAMQHVTGSDLDQAAESG